MKLALPLMKSHQQGLLVFFMFLALAVTLATVCALTCNPALARNVPTNYILLSIFTLAESALIGFICTRYTTESVLIVTGVTAFVVFGLTLFACQTTYDST